MRIIHALGSNCSRGTACTCLLSSNRYFEAWCHFVWEFDPHNGPTSSAPPPALSPCLARSWIGPAGVDAASAKQLVICALGNVNPRRSSVRCRRVTGGPRSCTCQKPLFLLPPSRRDVILSVFNLADTHQISFTRLLHGCLTPGNRL